MSPSLLLGEGGPFTVAAIDHPWRRLRQGEIYMRRYDVPDQEAGSGCRIDGLRPACNEARNQDALNGACSA